MKSSLVESSLYLSHATKAAHRRISALFTQYERGIQEFYKKLACLCNGLVSYTPSHWTGFDLVAVPVTSVMFVGFIAGFCGI
jgi:hypothetical protein